MEYLEDRLRGFADLDACIDTNMALSGTDMALVESRVTDNVMMKFNDQYNRKMNEEDKHTINNHEFLCTWVRKLELGHDVLEEKKEVLQVLQRPHWGRINSKRE